MRYPGRRERVRHLPGDQLAPEHEPPVWPADPGDPRRQAHLDVEVDDLAAAVEYARSPGAVQAGSQPQDDARVMLDPAGHPFRLFVG